MKSSLTNVVKGYPYLGEHVSNNFIVLFYAPKQGVVVWSHTPLKNVGNYSQEWSEEVFDKTTKEVKLSN